MIYKTKKIQIKRYNNLHFEIFIEINFYNN